MCEIERLKNIWATCFQTDLLIFLPRFFNSHVCVFDIAVDVVAVDVVAVVAVVAVDVVLK